MSLSFTIREKYNSSPVQSQYELVILTGFMQGEKAPIGNNLKTNGLQLASLLTEKIPEVYIMPYSKVLRQ